MGFLDDLLSGGRLFPDGDEELIEEEVTFVKGDFKTVITYKFTKDGILVSHGIRITPVNSFASKEELQKKLNAAVENQDYELAAEYKRKIDEINKSQEDSE